MFLLLNKYFMVTIENNNEVLLKQIETYKKKNKLLRRVNIFLIVYVIISIIIMLYNLLV